MTQTTNRLRFEKSPYLLQHQNNPVHWYAWGNEAFEAAKAENKPIFLSIGYSTCHWCHVMERDSFERQEVADALNRSFISIKVDREERPDVDDIYMAAVHAMGQRGGWPLSMFLTPDLKPFYGGTYWPREQFLVILEKLAKIWREQPEKIFSSGESILESIRTQKTEGGARSQAPLPDEKIFGDFFGTSAMSFDARWGGFGQAPKFPHTMQLAMLLRIHRRTQEPHALEMAVLSLDKMARGGIYDHLGGGFARYSTDAQWLVPHFEKMLYDNALLVKAYLEAFQVTGQQTLSSVAKETLDYVLRDMTHPEGGFCSAEDADSEGEEGKFYVWKQEDLKQILTPEEFALFAKIYGVTEHGNFEHGTNILSLQWGYGWGDKEAPLMASAHRKLFALREKRIHPHKDDKILTAWNGLMISAMAKGYQVLGDERYLKAAHDAAAFIRKNLYQNAKLLARYREGEGRFAAYLDDYAYLIQGLIDLYECDFDAEILKWAITLQDKQKELFWDAQNGGCFFSDGSDPSLLVRTKEGTDGAIPNGNAVTALNLLRLHDLTLQASYREDALATFQAFSALLKDYPHAFAQMLIALDYLTDSSKEVAILTSSKDGGALNFLKNLRRRFNPNVTLAAGSEGSDFPELLKGKTLLEGKTAFYVCEAKTCQKPTFEGEDALKTVMEGKNYPLRDS
ncbi:MAG: thioredoxin domain-containing protein [bacterium]